MNNDICLSGSIQEKRGKLYAVIGYKDPMTEMRKVKWIGLGLTPDAKQNVQNKALREAIAGFEEEYGKMLLGIKSPEQCVFLDFLYNWLETVKKPTLQPVTYANYKQLIERRIAKFFGNKLTLADITPIRINEFYTSIRKDGCQEKTVLQYHNLLHGACKWAVKQDILDRNPFDRVERPKGKKKTPNYYTPDQLKTLLKLAEGESLYIPIVLGAYYGLRRSEVLGLTWDHVDFDNKCLLIHSKVCEVKEDGKTAIIFSDQMKTDSSKRALPLLPAVEKILLRHKEQQEEYRRLFKSGYSTKYLNFVCVNPMGELIRPNYISETFGKLLERSGLPHIRFHDLRHSFTSMLIANDVGPKQAQVWLGHSNISTTMDIYAHLDYSVKKSMGITIGKLLDTEGNDEEEGEEK